MWLAIQDLLGSEIRFWIKHPRISCEKFENLDQFLMHFRDGEIAICELEGVGNSSKAYVWSQVSSFTQINSVYDTTKYL